MSDLPWLLAGCLFAGRPENIRVKSKILVNTFTPGELNLLRRRAAAFDYLSRACSPQRTERGKRSSHTSIQPYQLALLLLPPPPTISLPTLSPSGSTCANALFEASSRSRTSSCGSQHKESTEKGLQGSLRRGGKCPTRREPVASVPRTKGRRRSSATL